MDMSPRTPALDAGSPSDTTPSGTMDALIIRGGRKLSGRVEISGAKNAALPVMAATLLAPGVHTLRNVPQLADTRTMARVLEQLGARIEFQRATCKIDTSGVDQVEAPYDLVRTMRASIYVLGPAARALRRGARLASRRLRVGAASGQSPHRRPERA